jgi:NADH-quinone oxidoreductase subunit L
LPFIGALVTPVLVRIGSRTRDYGAVGFSMLAALSATLLIPGIFSVQPQDVQVDWISSLNIKAGILLDPLSIIVANVVAWISFLIMVYSLAYMRGDEGITRYWFFMNLFIGNMLLLVLSDNLLQLFFGWEGVGLCSYGLIGHWYTDPPDKYVGSPGHQAWKVPMMYSPSHAGMKAFIITRVGDIALLIAIFIIYAYSGTLNFVELAKSVSWVEPLGRLGLLVPVAVIFFGGAIGKSAQFPLHEWLPDAMAGPTSVSALIHAATMVNAGVYLVARAGPIFFNAFIEYGQVTGYFFGTVAWIGAFTAFCAASQALVSKELKKLLAYSTISQLGYMMLSIGAGGLVSEFVYSNGIVIGVSAAIFLLISHAFFKATAFLAAGNVLHEVRSRFMEDMGGLRRSMKITFVAMLIAMLANAGVPPLSGSWSKDATIATAVLTGRLPLLLVAWGTVGLTILYSIKLLGLVFYAPQSEHVRRSEKEGQHIHEVSPIMWIPCLIMAIATVAIGLPGLASESFLTRMLAVTAIPIAESPVSLSLSAEQNATLIAIGGSLVMLLVGGTLGYLLYISGRLKPKSIVREKGVARSIYNFLWNRWYINPSYYRIFGNGCLITIGKVRRWVEAGFFDKISWATGRSYFGFCIRGMNFDMGAVDGAINGIALTGRRVSTAARRIQSGIPQEYVLVFALGLFALIVAVLFLLPT